MRQKRKEETEKRKFSKSAKHSLEEVEEMPRLEYVAIQQKTEIEEMITDDEEGALRMRRVEAEEEDLVEFPRKMIEDRDTRVRKVEAE